MPIRLFKMGADPEFAFYSKSGSIRNASNLIEDEEGNDIFGLDGCETIAELRPIPSISPKQLVVNIRNALQDGLNRYPKTNTVKWKAGSVISHRSNSFATGGHIHFGLRGVPRRRISYSKISDVLDTFLAQPVLLLEIQNDADLRRSNEYGVYGDYKSNEHGFEYRVLGSWLTSPRVAEGVLCLAQTIAYETINNPKLKYKDLEPGAEKFESGEYDDEHDENDDVYYRHDVIRGKLLKIHSRIKKFKLYRRYEQPIGFLFRLIAKNKTWYPRNKDMKAAWGLEHSKKGKVLPRTKVEDIWER